MGKWIFMMFLFVITRHLFFSLYNYFMKHHIIVKFNSSAPKVSVIEPEIRTLFEKALCMDGIHGLEIKTNIVHRPNRYDMMIILDMESEALERYDSSDYHLQWKNQYGKFIERKAIFDSEN